MMASMTLAVLDRLLRKKLFDLLLHPQAFKRGLDDAVEQKGEVNKQSESNNLEPLERLPSQAKRDDPNEQGPASVDSRPRGGTDAPGDRETKKVEATGFS